MATQENIGLLARLVESRASSCAAFVFDLFGNSSVRFEQYVGTTALPFRSDGIFHLGGKIVTTPPDIFKKIVTSVLPILKAKGSKPCVIIPPLPRYLFSRCCGDASHCTNKNEPGFESGMLSDFIKLRNDLIINLVQSGITKFKVMDTCCITTCAPTENIPARLAELEKVTARDGIHFVKKGKQNLALRTISCLKTMLTVEKKAPKNTSFFWRGFRSKRGSLLPKVAVREHVAATRGTMRGRRRGGAHASRTRAFHPYRRW
jgi:hypothetical protein